MKPSRLFSILAAFFLTAGLRADEPTGREHDHIGQFNFTIEIEGVNAGHFKSVDGLSAEIEVIEYQDGDDLFLRKRPGRAKFGDITLKIRDAVVAKLGAEKVMASMLGN